MLELIYLANGEDYGKAFKLLEAEFPYATVSDASDEIHRNRLQIEGPIARDMFARWAIREGLFLNCLGYNIMLYEDRPQIKRWLEQVGRQK